MTNELLSVYLAACGEWPRDMLELLNPNAEDTCSDTHELTYDVTLT